MVFFQKNIQFFIKIFNIESADQSQSADLKAGVIAFSYYEDVMSPVITATAQIVNTGNSIKGKSIYQGLPLRGGEKVEVSRRQAAKFKEKMSL